MNINYINCLHILNICVSLNNEKIETMTNYKNDPTEEHDFEPDFNSTDLKECYAHFRATDDREPLENAIELMYEKIERAKKRIVESALICREHNFNETANSFIAIRNILT